jgi:hypothetical protein
VVVLHVLGDHGGRLVVLGRHLAAAHDGGQTGCLRGGVCNVPRSYIVIQGDCLPSIAAREGFFWDTIWNASSNAELRETRKDPAVLFPGDEVSIPDKRKKTAPVSSGRVNRFRIKGILRRNRNVG